MTDPVEAIARAIEKSAWVLRDSGVWRDVEARYLARVALAALEAAGYAIISKPEFPDGRRRWSGWSEPLT